MKSRRSKLRLVAAWAAIAAVGPALAVGPSREVVQERLFQFDGRFDVSLLGGLSMNNKLTDHYGVVLQPAYHLTDAWAIELMAGYMAGLEKRRLTDWSDPNDPSTQGIRPSVAAGGFDDEFADMGRISWLAHASVRWSPIYGKLSLASELPLHFGAYVSAGGGVVGVQRKSLVDCTSVADTDGDNYVDAVCSTAGSGPAPSVSIGAGLRLYLTDRFAIRAELRDFIFPDSYVVNFNAQPGDAQQRTEISGLTEVLMFMAGASFYF